MNCGQSMKPGTKAMGTCNINYYRSFQPTYSEIECQEDGRWNEPLFFCTPGITPQPCTTITINNYNFNILQKPHYYYFKY